MIPEGNLLERHELDDDLDGEDAAEEPLEEPEDRGGPDPALVGRGRVLVRGALESGGVREKGMAVSF